MKRILMAIMLGFISISSFAQLHKISLEEAHGYRDVIVFKNVVTAGYIRYAGGTYILCGVTTDHYDDEMATIYLGDDKESSIATIEDLCNLKLGKEPIIVLGAAEAETSIFKFMGGLEIETEGVAGISGVLGYLKPKKEKAIKAIQDFNEDE